MEHQFLLIAGVGLAIMVAASVFSRRTGVAAPLLLVGLGIGASYLPDAPTIVVNPELILAGVLPPLLYATAVNLPVIDVRRNLFLISWLSVVMVVASALVIGAVVHLLFPDIPFALATALGAVVSPTDAVAATAIGRRVGLPPRVMAVLEGESLVNDASALVVLRTAVAATAGFSVGDAVLDFVWAVVGAALVGVAVGILTTHLRQRLDDPVLNTTISFAIPFLAYFPAEEVGGSGVLAVVVAGLVTGAMGSRRLSGRDRQSQTTTWTTISFILESGVFLAMGYQLPQLVDDASDETTVGQMTALVAVVVVLLVALRFTGLAWPALRGRLARRGPGERGDQLRVRLDRFEEHLDSLDPDGEREETRLAWARRRLARGRADVAFEEREPLTARGITAIAWAGMRGVVTVAAAQTIPVGTPHRNTVVLAAFLVALLTLVLFGLTLPAVIRRLGFEGESHEARRDAVHALLRRVGESAIDELGPLEEQRVDGEPVDPQLAESLRDRILPRLVTGVRQATAPRPDGADQALVLQRRYLEAMRDALTVERGIGAYSSATYRQVETLLDSLEQRIGRD